MRRLVYVLSAFAVVSCRAPGPRSPPLPAAPVPDEVSLKADRSALDALRIQEPEEVKRRNDELALLLALMKDGSEDPGKVRDRFGKIVRDKRDLMDKRLRKEREAFGKRETQAREALLKDLAKRRARQLSRKHPSDENKEFYDDQEAKRKGFFDEQRDRRAEFESKALESRKDFEDDVREKTNWFSQEMRAYSTSFYERQKAEGLQRSMKEKERQVRPPANPDAKDFQEIPKAPGEALRSGEGA